jgi:3-isopropylmalate dehydrogenase
MTTSNEFRIAVLPGDGIGHEVMAPCIAVLEAAAARVGKLRFRFETHQAGAFSYRDTGVALPRATLEAARRADAILLGAMGWPEIRYPDGTEIAPQLDLRFEFGLFAGVRPVRTLPRLPAILADKRASQLDFVVIRESTEGLFASRGRGELIEDREARDTMVVTRGVCEPLFDFAFALARRRRATGGKGIVTCVDKANVFTSLAFFRKVFDERAALNPDIDATRAYIDATALDMVRRPWTLDVLVTENMFGDILSDLGAGLMGGMGFAPSADIGTSHAVFQPCHGTAPDIAGQGKANPTAMILSAAMMLDWLGERHASSEAVAAGRMIKRAVDHAYEAGVAPMEIGGSDGTEVIARKILAALDDVLPLAAGDEALDPHRDSRSRLLQPLPAACVDAHARGRAGGRLRPRSGAGGGIRPRIPGARQLRRPGDPTRFGAAGPSRHRDAAGHASRRDHHRSRSRRRRHLPKAILFEPRRSDRGHPPGQGRGNRDRGPRELPLSAVVSRDRARSLDGPAWAGLSGDLQAAAR